MYSNGEETNKDDEKPPPPVTTMTTTTTTTASDDFTQMDNWQEIVERVYSTPTIGNDFFEFILSKLVDSRDHLFNHEPDYEPFYMSLVSFCSYKLLKLVPTSTLYFLSNFFVVVLKIILNLLFISLKCQLIN